MDPVYTGKLLFGIFDLIKSKQWAGGKKILVIHTGGLQGIKGMNQKLSKKMAHNHYLTSVFLILTLIFNSCGSTKKVKINASRPAVKTSENIKAKPMETQIKPLKSSKKLSVAERVDRYVKTYAEVAQREMKSYYIPASITLAQGILESGMGDSRLATQANNHFGIKCHKEWGVSGSITMTTKKGNALGFIKTHAPPIGTIPCF